jgi:NAD(P)H-hydrate repair Nnr-like enzyme with NAD(P)H-hydrate dehydratase domain
MARLLSVEAEAVRADPLEAGRRAAARFSAVVVMKGVATHVVTPDGRAWRHDGGCRGLGVSGSGDVLAGVIGGLLARGAAPATAALWGVWLHGAAGEALSRAVGSLGFLARELPGEIPRLLDVVAGTS